MEMITLKMISERIGAWLRNRVPVRGWPAFSDNELRPIRVCRSDNEEAIWRRGPDSAGV